MVNCESVAIEMFAVTQDASEIMTQAGRVHKLLCTFPIELKFTKGRKINNEPSPA